MATRMLIDATHAEETRVVVLKGNRIEEFDFETSTKQVLKGNIYLAKVTRVEPSLQAAFVDFGGNRHGFLAFSEIHPDYYQIPVADREALKRELEAEEQAIEAEEDAAAEAEAASMAASHGLGPGPSLSQDLPASEADTLQADWVEPVSLGDAVTAPLDDAASPAVVLEDATVASEVEAQPLAYNDDRMEDAEAFADGEEEDDEDEEDDADEEEDEDADDEDEEDADDEDEGDEPLMQGGETAETVEALADEATAEGDNAIPARRDEGRRRRGRNKGGRRPKGRARGEMDAEESRRSRRLRLLRQYKIQEVIKRRQIMLVQVVKEERGNKGAALTTYLSLAGRYCVLMPNTARGGGISRKIVSPSDRKRLKSIAKEINVPTGMGMIIRTAGMEKEKTEIERDFEFLLRSWESICEMTMQSTAPCLIYEEANLIKRAIRDLYNNGTEDILVEGREGFNAAKSFMQMLMPDRIDQVKLYQDRIPLFQRYQVESQLDAIFSNTVQLRSGGYIVINPTEALVAIDVNSGRSTREHHIEETALKTNLEAAEEVARQLRLRDLAGLIVIDFIDMSDSRANRQVEKRMKDCLRSDRARIQVGRISSFGLLEMSRQRLRPSILESSSQVCPHCQGTGHIRSVESSALHVLHAIEEEAVRGRSAEVEVAVASKVAIYLLNNKRRQLQNFEDQYGLRVTVLADDSLIPPDYRLERVRTPAEPVGRPEPVRAITSEDQWTEAPAETESFGDDTDGPQDETREEGRGGRRRNRRRRRGRNGEATQMPAAAPADLDFDELALELGAEARENAILPEDEEDEGEDEAEGTVESADAQGNGQRRRRGRRGGRRRRGRGDRPREEAMGQEAPEGVNGHDEGVAPPAPVAEPLAYGAETAPVTAPIPPEPPAPVASEPNVISSGEEPAKPRFGWWRRK